MTIDPHSRPIFDDEYAGPRYRYGMTYRPPGLSGIPGGFIVGSEMPHPSFRFGTIDYPFRLDDRVVAQMELTEVSV